MTFPAATPANLASYRFGKTLTLAVVFVTAVLLLWPQIWAAATGQLPEPKSQIVIANHSLGKAAAQWLDFAVSNILIFVLCGCAWRGGSLSSGCLTIFYSGALLSFAVAGTMTTLLSHWGTAKGIDIHFASLSLNGVNRDLNNTLAFLVIGAWSAFAFWVLVMSKDARFYRDTRRRGVRLDASPTKQNSLPLQQP